MSHNHQLLDKAGLPLPLDLVREDFRVPCKNDLYVNKNGLLQRCKAKNHSKRAKKRLIVVEGWL